MCDCVSMCFVFHDLRSLLNVQLLSTFNVLQNRIGRFGLVSILLLLRFAGAHLCYILIMMSYYSDLHVDVNNV